MSRNTQAFDLQFQWEVDRIVFRHRQRGVPVEVTATERDFYQSLYSKRLRLLGRILSNTMLGCAALTIVGLFSLRIGSAAYLPLVMIIGLIIVTPFADRWSFDETTRTLRDRPAIGEPLGRAGRLLRPLSQVPARKLWGSLAYLLFVTALVSPMILKFDATGWFLLVVCALVFLLFAAALLVKGAQAERNRLQRESGKLIGRARRLGQD